MKIVKNNCYGGFGLSNKAIARYLELKGINAVYYDLKDFSRIGFKSGIENYIEISKEEYINNKMEYLIYPRPFLGRLEKEEDTNRLYFRESSIPRDDKYLIQVVEELGREVNSVASELIIVEIPDNIDWEISEYDGQETVEEKHRSW